MLVDGKVRRICITKVDEVKNVNRIDESYLPEETFLVESDGKEIKIRKTNRCNYWSRSRRTCSS